MTHHNARSAKYFKTLISPIKTDDHHQPSSQLSSRSINVTPLFIASIVILGGINGCSNPNEANYESVTMADAVNQEMVDPMSTGAMDSAQVLQVENISASSEQTLGSQVADMNIDGKELVVTASARFKVDDVVTSTKAIETLTRHQGGYVASSIIDNSHQYSHTFTQDDQDITLTTYYRQAHMSVRIPRQKVNEFLDQVQQQVKFLEYQEFRAEDVTLDIYREKLAAQLNSNMADELRHERLNSDNELEQNSNVDSIVTTYDAQRRAQLAKLQQMQIADRLKYSSIDLDFSQPDVTYKDITPNLQSSIKAYEPSFISQVAHAFTTGWDMLQKALITIIGFWWLLPVLTVLYLIFKLIKALYRYFAKKFKSA